MPSCCSFLPAGPISRPRPIGDRLGVVGVNSTNRTPLPGRGHSIVRKSGSEVDNSRASCSCSLFTQSQIANVEPVTLCCCLGDGPGATGSLDSSAARSLRVFVWVNNFYSCTNVTRSVTSTTGVSLLQLTRPVVRLYLSDFINGT